MLKFYLSTEEFRKVVRTTNLIALDLIVQDKDNRVLVGLRKNPPAQGLWFVPGGRVFKNERLHESLNRILNDEINLPSKKISDIALHGIYDHIYDDNVFGDPTFNTHYIIVACRVTVCGKWTAHNDDQHEQMKFMPIEDLLSDPSVHNFTKYYFINDAPNRFL